MPQQPTPVEIAHELWSARHDGRVVAAVDAVSAALGANSTNSDLFSVSALLLANLLAHVKDTDAAAVVMAAVGECVAAVRLADPVNTEAEAA